MFASLGGEGDEVRTQGRPGWLVGNAGHHLVGSAVERVHDAGSDELFGSGVSPVYISELRTSWRSLGRGYVPTVQ
jgi:hypothetical protein